MSATIKKHIHPSNQRIFDIFRCFFFSCRKEWRANWTQKRKENVPTVRQMWVADRTARSRYRPFNCGAYIEYSASRWSPTRLPRWNWQNFDFRSSCTMWTMWLPAPPRIRCVAIWSTTDYCSWKSISTRRCHRNNCVHWTSIVASAIFTMSRPWNTLISTPKIYAESSVALRLPSSIAIAFHSSTAWVGDAMESLSFFKRFCLPFPNRIGVSSVRC